MALATTLALTACGNLRQRDAAIADDALPGPALAAFHLQGRAMLRQAQRVDHFRFDWRHDDTLDALDIVGPFGQTLARLRRDDNGVQVQFSDGRQASAATLGDLAQAIFGQQLPLDELAHWLRGARPARHARVDDWEIAIESVERVAGASGASHLLPRVQTMRRDDVQLRLIVDEWNMTP